MTELLALKQTIQHRFNRLTLSLQGAQNAMGINSEQQIAAENSIQNDNRRELLRIEKQAIRDKQLNQRSHENFVNSVRDMVLQEVFERVEKTIADEEFIFNKVLNFDERLPPLLDALSVKATSISKIEPLAADIPWLYDELIKLVNSPKYRRTDGRGKVLIVDTLKVALTFLGFENLKLIIPSLAFRRLLPQITDPFPEIKIRLWQSAIGTSKSCKKLARMVQVDSGQAFVLGLFHDVGKIVLVRLYFKLFDEVQREAMIEAHDEKKREEHSALMEIKPSDEFLTRLFDAFAGKLSASLITRMGFKRLFIANAMDDYVQHPAIANMSAMGKVLAQGIAYNQYRTLKQYKLIGMDEARDFLKQFYFPKGALSELKTVDLRQLDIEISE